MTRSAVSIDLVEMKTKSSMGPCLAPTSSSTPRDSIFLRTFVGGLSSSTSAKCSHAGLINENCVVEVEGKHYCFGRDDIIVHDGTTKQSIADER